MPRQAWMLTEADVSLLLNHSIKAAMDMGIAVTVAVVEQGGNTIGLLRMDGAKLASIDVAVGKAWTAALFQRPSGEYGASTAPGGNSYGVLNAYPGRMVPLPGGQPIFAGGACIGGVGVSGATAEQDDHLARGAVAALKNEGENLP